MLTTAKTFRLQPIVAANKAPAIDDMAASAVLNAEYQAISNLDPFTNYYFILCSIYERLVNCELLKLSLA